MSDDDRQAAIEDANDLLAEAIDAANRYLSHEEVRPSAVQAFDRLHEAHIRLCEVDDTRAMPETEVDE